MRILFIRHGDPDYINDTLTKKGHREAKLLAERAADLNLGSCYVSPLGRAKDTAQYCLDKVGKTAQTVEWLREFPARIDLNFGIDRIFSTHPCPYILHVPSNTTERYPTRFSAHTDHFLSPR